MPEIIIYSTPNNLVFRNLEQAMDTIESVLSQDFYSSIDKLSQNLISSMIFV